MAIQRYIYISEELLGKLDDHEIFGMENFARSNQNL